MIDINSILGSIRYQLMYIKEYEYFYIIFLYLYFTALLSKILKNKNLIFLICFKLQQNTLINIYSDNYL